MKERDLPRIDERDVRQPTETIDLNDLFRPTMSDSGSFDVGTARYGAFCRLLQAIPVPVLLIDRSFHVRFTNRAVETLGRNSSSLIGSSFSSLFPGAAMARKGMSLVKFVFTRRKPQTAQGMLTICGTSIWGRMHLRSIRIGPSKFVLVLIENLTAEKELGAIQKYRKLVQVFPLGIAEFALKEPILCGRESRDPIPLILDARLVDGNLEFAKMHGYETITQLHGLPLGALFPFDKEAFDHCRTWVENGFPSRSAERTETKSSGGTTYFEDTLISNVNEDRLLGFWGVRRNITKQRMLEERVRHAQRMEAIGSLAGGIAHEIRNPLGICSSAAQFLLEEEISPEFRRECAEKIQAAAHRASRIIEDLFNFARPHPISAITAVQLIPVLREALKLARQAGVTYKVALTSNCPEEEVLVPGNAGLLQQVFVNLFSNSFSAMPEGGELRVSLERTAKHYVVRISDTGHGIEKKDMGRIFDPFYSASPIRKGTGLGLSIAYSIVKEHSGSIEVESTSEHGSTFTVRLPRALNS
ncbi:MAG: ATP-binding protein [Thermodesulfobacteriota bacterium]